MLYAYEVVDKIELDKIAGVVLAKIFGGNLSGTSKIYDANVLLFVCVCVCVCVYSSHGYGISMQMFPVLLHKCLLLKYLGPYLVRYTFSFACIFQPMFPDKLNKRRIRWNSKIQSFFFEKKK
jgi:hypothetical protein